MDVQKMCKNQKLLAAAGTNGLPFPSKAAIVSHELEVMGEG